MTMKKSQSAIEFVFLVSFMILVFAGFFVVLQNKIVDVVETNDETYVSELNNIVVNEVFVASKSFSDYSHVFFIPTHIQGNPFTITILNNSEVVSFYKGIEQVNFLNSSVVGPIYVGENELHKTDGKIILKNGSNFYNSSYQGLFLNVNPEWCYLYNQTILAGESACKMFDLSYLNLCKNLFGLCLTTVWEPDTYELD